MEKDIDGFTLAAPGGVVEHFAPTGELLYEEDLRGLRRTTTDLLRRAAGSVVSKALISHATDEMHEHYSTVDLSEKREAVRRAFRVALGDGTSGGGSGGGSQ